MKIFSQVVNKLIRNVPRTHVFIMYVDSIDVVLPHIICLSKLCESVYLTDVSMVYLTCLLSKQNFHIGPSGDQREAAPTILLLER